MSVEAIYIGNSQLLRVMDLTNTLDGSPAGSAIIDATIVDAMDVPVTGVTWPISLTLIAGTASDYQGLVPATIQLTLGADYFAKITADGGGGLVAEWRLPCRAKYRES